METVRNIEVSVPRGSTVVYFLQINWNWNTCYQSTSDKAYMHPHLHFIIKFGKILVRYIAPNKMGMHMYKIYEKWDTKIISYFL